jgi:hypothetical protein
MTPAQKIKAKRLVREFTLDGDKKGIRNQGETGETVIPETTEV